MSSEVKKDRSLILLKPDAVQRSLVGEMIKRFEQKGLKFTAMKMIMATEAQCEDHYNKDDAWFEEKGQKVVDEMEKEGVTPEKPAIEYGRDIIRTVVKYMTAGPILAIIAEGHRAPDVVTSLVGTTEPLSADIGTIRGDFTIDSYYMATIGNRAIRNLIHCSEDDDEAKREIKIWFDENEIMDYATTQERVLYDVNGDGLWE